MAHGDRSGGGQRLSKSLGAVLAKARADKDLSLRDVEKLTGINNGHLSQIESGTIAKPAVGILWHLANVYELDFTKLMELAERAGPASRRGPSRSLVGAALHTIDDLSPDEEQELLTFMEHLRRKRQDGE
jgi:HTH-type transcriptional regulator, competence development regulator